MPISTFKSIEKKEKKKKEKGTLYTYPNNMLFVLMIF